MAAIDSFQRVQRLGDRSLCYRWTLRKCSPTAAEELHSTGQSAEEYSLIAVDSRVRTEAQHCGSGAGQLRCAQQMDIYAGGRSGIAEVHLSKRERRSARLHRSSQCDHGSSGDRGHRIST
jgi:hypothetical protein